MEGEKGDPLPRNRSVGSIVECLFPAPGDDNAGEDIGPPNCPPSCVDMPLSDQG